ncbi:bacterial hemolysin-related [Abeliophyllum distichum]|uniref:Bacterial hemolysin-related n=1 Tax=Abeliophyllum distichum TaxID=126358 RepID=A0ABD1VV19_9LAMI
MELKPKERRKNGTAAVCETNRSYAIVALPLTAAASSFSRPDYPVPGSLGRFKYRERKRDLMKYVLKDFSNIAEHSYNRGYCKAKLSLMEKSVNKSGTPISDRAVVEIKAEVPKYGYRTGGFTDCLLQHGASFVYGVDVGYGQVADKIRRDNRVSVIERTNLRYLLELPQMVDLVTLDLSFISILTVMPAVVNLMKEEAILVTLIKPQFEARRSHVGGGGIVRDPLVHQEVLEKIIEGVQDQGFHCKGWIESPMKGAEGNKEFLACFSRIATKDMIPISKVPEINSSMVLDNP